MIASSVENCALCYVCCYFLFFLRPQFDGQRGKVETLFHGLTYLSPVSVSLTYCISWFNTGCCICNIDAYITRCTECLMNVQFGVLVLFYIFLKLFFIIVFFTCNFPLLFCGYCIVLDSSCLMDGYCTVSFQPWYFDRVLLPIPGFLCDTVTSSPVA